MSNQTGTIDTFLGFTRDHAPGGEGARTAEAALPTARIGQAIRKKSGGRITAVSTAALIAAIAGLLRVPLLDILTRAWKEGKLFRKYLDPQRYDPDEVISITLKKHEVRSTHKPKIDVELNGQTIDSIDFELDLALTLEGVILDIQNGNVRKVRAGRIKGKGIVKCEGLVLFQRETEAMELPGVLQFSATGRESFADGGKFVQTAG